MAKRRKKAKRRLKRKLKKEEDNKFSFLKNASHGLNCGKRFFYFGVSITSSCLVSILVI